MESMSVGLPQAGDFARSVRSSCCCCLSHGRSLKFVNFHLPIWEGGSRHRQGWMQREWDGRSTQLKDWTRRLFINTVPRVSPFTEKGSVKKVRGKGLWSPGNERRAELSHESCTLTGSEIYSRSDESHCATPLNSTWPVAGREIFGRERDNEKDVGIRSESDVSKDREVHDDNSDYSDGSVGSRLPELREILKLLRQRWAIDAASGRERRGPGKVYLVGTGPGDPELLTLKALRLMQSADLVLYDRLVSTEILDLVHSGARLLYVGKTSGYHSHTQEEIHELLLNFAGVGATVLRLKGGDPLVFGRGGEEMDFMKEQGIQVQVVPGITAASGIAAELGIPLTQRGIANSVRYLTGHMRKGGADPLCVAEQAVDPDSTLVIYMGLASLPGLSAKLIANGLSPHTPAAAIERGTTIEQRTVFSRLETLPADVAIAKLVSPTLIFIGQVVMLSPMWPLDLSKSTPPSTTNLVDLKRSLIKEPRLRQFRGPDPGLPSQV